MTRTRISSLLLGGSLLLCSSVLAGPANKKSLHLYDTVVVEGKSLAPGDYRIEWSDSGSDVQLSILQGKETVAIATARVVPVSNAPANDSYSVASAPDGSKTLTQLLFSGKKYELDIQSASAASSAQTDAGGRPN